MKKIALAVVLLVIIVAASYFRSVRDQSSRQKLYQDGLDKGSQQTQLYQSRADSLHDLMVIHDSLNADSIFRLTQAHQSETDSLTQVITARDQALLQAAQKKKTSTLKAPAKPRQPDTLQTSLKHSEILTYYKRRLAELPKDLSDYEKKIALDEVKEETSRKFSIDVKELEKIRLANNLTE